MLTTEIITKSRLKKYYAAACYLIKLGRELEEFKKNYNALKSSNFENVRVTSGSKKISPEEMYLISLANKEKKYKRFIDFVESEKPIIKAQIDRVSNPDYHNILTDRYINLLDWKLIELEYFGNESDFWVQRDFKYHFVTMVWHDRAVKALEKISQKPFIPADKQLLIGENYG